MRLEVDRAKGTMIWDKTGKPYYDLISGIAVCNIGHRHPRVVEAIEQQLKRYMHVIPYGEFDQDIQNKLAEKLSELLPAGLDSCYFVNSGTEANEGALKLAKRYTGRSELIAFRGAYHGSTHGSLSVSSNEEKKYRVRPLLPDVRFISHGEVEELSAITTTTAAVIIEPIQGDAGVRIPSKEYLLALRKKCTETGTLLLFDEIQTGCGRTGKMWAMNHYDVQPDIVTLAKSLGAGMPIGAFVSSIEIMRSLSHEPALGHITTFGGNPVCCAAAHANLDVLSSTRIVEKVEEKGALFESLLVHSSIKEIRRVGLMMAVELDSPEAVNKLVDACLERGVIAFYFLSTRNAFRLQPPLTISREEIISSCELMMDAFDSIS